MRVSQRTILRLLQEPRSPSRPHEGYTLLNAANRVLTIAINQIVCDSESPMDPRAGSAFLTSVASKVSRYWANVEKAFDPALELVERYRMTIRMATTSQKRATAQKEAIIQTSPLTKVRARKGMTRRKLNRREKGKPLHIYQNATRVKKQNSFVNHQLYL